MAADTQPGSDLGGRHGRPGWCRGSGTPDNGEQARLVVEVTVGEQGPLLGGHAGHFAAPT
ncbi:hypothetical protein ACTXJ8_07070 [Corynebacterium variabile]|uniref:hypothetical protein n=1 Tax=Corynebacterium variabile TaxID=1727 RepID=UPI003FD2C3F4